MFQGRIDEVIWENLLFSRLVAKNMGKMLPRRQVVFPKNEICGEKLCMFKVFKRKQSIDQCVPGPCFLPFAGTVVKPGFKFHITSPNAPTQPTESFKGTYRPV